MSDRLQLLIEPCRDPSVVGPRPITSVKMQTVLVRRSEASRSEWDGFSQACGASHRSSFRAAAVLNLGFGPGWRVVRLEIMVDAGQGPFKIGQCAVFRAWGCSAFADRLQLLPDHAGLWRAAMIEVLRVLGPGRYSYGSLWSTEALDASALASLPGVSIQQFRSFYMETIDFGRHPSWGEYWRGVSTNARRNYARAADRPVPLDVTVATGRAVMRDYPAAMRLRLGTLKRKSVAQSALSLAVNSLGRVACLLGYASLMTCRRDGALVAFSLSVEYGRATYYLEGGSDPSCDGAAWLVLLSTIKRAYERTGGTGTFVMGSVDEDMMNRPDLKGLSRSRRQCRATLHPTATAIFVYGGEAQRSPTPASAALQGSPSRNPGRPSASRA